VHIFSILAKIDSAVAVQANGDDLVLLAS
jgi:hypothetical protein